MMIGLWMAYAVLVALLLGGAAAALERALRLRGRAARGVWAAALAGSWLLPVLTWLRPPEAVAPVAAASGGTGGIDPTLLLWLMETAATVPATTRPWVGALGDALLAGWIVVAAGGFVLFALAVRRVVRQARRWPRQRVLGEPVRVSPDFGPAVVGLRRPEIVVPRWVMELGRVAQDLVIRHEREHRNARDTLLLAAATVATLAAPWNPALWWQLRRLRLAVELDCDARVLRAGVSPRSYGDLLLSVGERMRGSVVPMAALAEPPSFLERRLKMISERKRNGSAWKVVTGLVAAGILVAAACETPAPTVVEDGATAGTLQAAEQADTRLRIRTPTDIDGTGAKPLIVVDGVVLEAADGDAAGGRGVLRNLRPDDIASIEVVKGEAARALHGERAEGGVIHITTKAAEGGGSYELRELPMSEVDPEAEAAPEAEGGPEAAGTLSRARAAGSAEFRAREVVEGARVFEGAKLFEARERIEGERVFEAREMIEGESVASDRARALADANGAESRARTVFETWEMVEQAKVASERANALYEARGVVTPRIGEVEDNPDREIRFEVGWVAEVEEEPGLAQRVLGVAERGLTRALRLIAKPLASPEASSGAPLVVVDGEVWSQARLQSIERERIDRIEVLKGDAAREAYGERGADGVIRVFLETR